MTIAERTALGGFSHVDADPGAAALIAALDEQASLPAIQRLRASAAEILRPWSGDRLLDVGCGTGEVVRALVAGSAARFIAHRRAWLDTDDLAIGADETR